MRRMVPPAILAVALAALPSPAPADPALKGWSGPKPTAPCRCRHKGGKALLGETICQVRNGQMITLRCDLVLNNTSWTEVAKGCDMAMRSVAPRPRRL